MCNSITPAGLVLATRTAMGLSQAAFAQRIGVAGAWSVTRYEAGGGTVPKPVIELCKLLLAQSRSGRRR